MSFTSIIFVAFFAVTFALYYAWPSTRWQNAVVFAASCIFYGYWDWRLLGLLALSTAIAYSIGRALPRLGPKLRHWLLTAAIVVLLFILGFFKYANFFIESAETIVAALTGQAAAGPALHILLPIGISFYTFQAIAYLVDVARGTVQPERDVIIFGSFKLFFPQLVAGPIERAHHLLPQFHRVRRLTALDLQEAVWLASYGYFLKVVIADSMGRWVDSYFSAPPGSGWTSVLATLMFSVQIYGDFCGYSLIAVGLGRLFGIRLSWNFDFPYWSTSIREFWHRWHITLGSWLRDYLYVPLGGSRHGMAMRIRNLVITMTLGGLWHGANWTFVLWGLLHGAALSVNHALGKLWPRQYWVGLVLGWALTMLVVQIGWMLFRAPSIGYAAQMASSLGNMIWLDGHDVALRALLGVAIPLAALEYVQVRAGDRLVFLRWPFALRTGLQGLMIWMTLMLVTQSAGKNFIYFQF